MKFKIMITGKNRKLIASDISKHLEKEIKCTTSDCPPLKSELLDAALSEKPSVILILVKDETAAEVKVYDILREYTKLHAAKIIVVADEVDRKVFMRSTGLDKILFLPRQVSLNVLCDRINELRSEFEEEDKQTRFIEFVNPEPVHESTRKHILVVDDDAQQLAQIKEHLGEFYDVTLVNAGKYVLQCLEKFRIDLIFLDYLMPEMNGPEVLTMLREDERYKDIPVVFLTGVAEKETVIKTIKEFLPQGYILKPTTKADIVCKVIEILG